MTATCLSFLRRGPRLGRLGQHCARSQPQEHGGGLPLRRAEQPFVATPARVGGGQEVVRVAGVEVQPLLPRQQLHVGQLPSVVQIVGQVQGRRQGVVGRCILTAGERLLVEGQEAVVQPHEVPILHRWCSCAARERERRRRLQQLYHLRPFLLTLTLFHERVPSVHLWPAASALHPTTPADRGSQGQLV